MAVTINGSTGVQLDDNDKQEFGTGDDLQIYHNGTYSQIKNTTGGLYLENTGEIGLISGTYASGEWMVRAIKDGAVELYCDNSKRFETTSTGVSITVPSADGEYLLDVKGTAAKQFGFYYDQGSWLSATFRIDEFNSDGTAKKRIAIDDGGVELYNGSDIKFKTYSSGVYCYGHIRPSPGDTHDVGINGAKWDDVYATNGTIQTSDRNEKNTIVDTDLGLSFVNKLKPVSYKFNGKTRTHYGLISQDIETVLSDISKPTVDFAGFIKEDLPDELYDKDDTLPEGKKVGDVKVPAYTTYGLRYNEFISPLIKAVQELSAEVDTLKAKVAALEAG